MLNLFLNISVGIIAASYIAITHLLIFFKDDAFLFHCKDIGLLNAVAAV